MDEGCSEAVKEVFIRLFDKGYIYKGSRIINWCPVCKTSISDAEVEHVEQDRLSSGTSTTRSVGEEGTLCRDRNHPSGDSCLGDTAVAVNPDDERYTGYYRQEVTASDRNRP